MYRKSAKSNLNKMFVDKWQHCAPGKEVIMGWWQRNAKSLEPIDNSYITHFHTHIPQTIQHGLCSFHTSHTSFIPPHMSICMSEIIEMQLNLIAVHWEYVECTAAANKYDIGDKDIVFSVVVSAHKDKDTHQHPHKQQQHTLSYGIELVSYFGGREDENLIRNHPE